MDQSYKYDVDIAKNYLNEKKLKERFANENIHYVNNGTTALELAYKEYDKFKVRQDRLYKSDFDNFLNETRMIENGSDK